MELTPFHMKVAGIAVIVAVAAGFLFWAARTVLGIHRGYPVYMLPDPDHDDPGSDEAHEGDHVDT